MAKIELEQYYSVYEGVRGKSLTKKEIEGWKQERFYDFIEFARYFMDTDTEEATLLITKERVKKAETKFIPIDYHPFQEFLFRIDRFTSQSDFDCERFRKRLHLMMVMVLRYLKEHPHRIDDRIRELVGINPRLNWCLSLVKEEETRIGTIVVANNTDADGKVITQVTPDKLMLESLANVASLINELTGSFTASELKKMKTNDKFSAISKLSFVYNVGKNFKPNAGVFKQINIINSKPEDIEKTLLGVATGEQE